MKNAAAPAIYWLYLDRETPVEGPLTWAEMEGRRAGGVLSAGAMFKTGEEGAQWQAFSVFPDQDPAATVLRMPARKAPAAAPPRVATAAELAPDAMPGPQSGAAWVPRGDAWVLTALAFGVGTLILLVCGLSADVGEPVKLGRESYEVLNLGRLQTRALYFEGGFACLICTLLAAHAAGRK